MYINASVARVNNMSTSLALETRQAFKSFKSKYFKLSIFKLFQYIDHMVQTVRFWFTWGEGMD